MLDRFFRLLADLRGATPADAHFLFDPAEPAGRLRLANLRRYLDLVAGTSTLLVAEAPGYRGMTVTGVPFMSVRELAARPGLASRRAEGDGFEVPASAFGWELSASVVQKALAAWPDRPPACWSIYPNHPFTAGSPATNRAPRADEVRAGAPIALALIEALDVRRVVAVGRKAQGALALAGIEAEAVRHPAQGGAGIFAARMAELAAAA